MRGVSGAGGVPFSFPGKQYEIENIVTSFLPGTGRNLGFGGLPEHGDRYARADDFVEVVYKLLEASWEDDAVVPGLRPMPSSAPAPAAAARRTKAVVKPA